ncbi:uncharacterized protein SCHCODRAFT_02627328 [Schizophyllum commune H4-8]|uniref:uncharacterized protein n=1 Tax=Schizophyllum commune (strain H4-8 / FGSC 9210) TaxID=578458 RepID=UPI00215E5BED|nr:uncharacterized protein SCHCODRAFT_02627328 [Schizophyllum commune H4-8]KAI5892864.1 hypothetical protein SCHCODRAFT_02627328 [Schizophyllum commune H4-8]
MRGDNPVPSLYRKCSAENHFSQDYASNFWLSALQALNDDLRQNNETIRRSLDDKGESLRSGSTTASDQIVASRRSGAHSSEQSCS